MNFDTFEYLFNMSFSEVDLLCHVFPFSFDYFPSYFLRVYVKTYLFSNILNVIAFMQNSVNLMLPCMRKLSSFLN